MTKLCMSVDIQDLITYATFGDDRFGRGKESNFQFPHWLVSSPLQYVCKRIRMLTDHTLAR